MTCTCMQGIPNERTSADNENNSADNEIRALVSINCYLLKSMHPQIPEISIWNGIPFREVQNFQLKN